MSRERVRAEINVLLARDQALDDFPDLGMDERLTAGDADHRRAAFLDGVEALLRAQALLEDVLRVLDLAAAGAGEVALKEGLEHEGRADNACDPGASV
ncbi:MAG: hypothetical protein WDO13_10655 [Verrucomicrobiota bacterium]